MAISPDALGARRIFLYYFKSTRVPAKLVLLNFPQKFSESVLIIFEESKNPAPLKNPSYKKKLCGSSNFERPERILSEFALVQLGFFRGSGKSILKDSSETRRKT